MAAVAINPMGGNKMVAMGGWGGTKMAAMAINPMGGNKVAAMGAEQNGGRGGLGEEPRWRPWP